MEIDISSIQNLYEKIEFLELQIEHYKFICLGYKDICYSYSELSNKINNESRQDKPSSRCF